MKNILILSSMIFLFGCSGGEDSAINRSQLDLEACKKMISCLRDHVPAKAAIYSSELSRLDQSSEPEQHRMSCIRMNAAASQVAACDAMF